MLHDQKSEDKNIKYLLFLKLLLKHIPRHRRQKILFQIKCFNFSFKQDFKLLNQNQAKTFKVKITYKVINLERVPRSSIINKE